MAGEDRDRLLWIKTQPCCAPGAPDGCRGPVEAHHAGRRGVGQKAADDTAIPLCAAHHRGPGWHDHRGPFRFWTQLARREWADEQVAICRSKYAAHQQQALPDWA